MSKTVSPAKGTAQADGVGTIVETHSKSVRYFHGTVGEGDAEQTTNYADTCVGTPDVRILDCTRNWECMDVSCRNTRFATSFSELIN